MEWYAKEVAGDPFGLGGTKNGETWVDLRLGETSNSVKNQARAVSKSVSSSSSSSSSSSKTKRSREYYNAPANAKCSVDGCKDDLKDCRDYHRRHRVCEMHSKTAVVLIKGNQQRFCQQCSRFHPLDEFDEFKRSCRRRLEGHNRRRRKPHPRPLYFSSDYNGPRLLQFGSPNSDTYGKAYLSMWPAPPKKTEPLSFNAYLDQPSLVSAFANIQNLQDRQVPVLQPNGNEAVGGISMSQYQQIHGSDGTNRVPPEAASGTNYQNTSQDSALYLLSAVQAPSSEFGVVESSMSCPIQLQPPSGHIHFDGTDKCSSCSRRVMSEGSDPTWSVGASANIPNLHCNGMLRNVPDGVSENGEEGSTTFPFSWE